MHLRASSFSHSYIIRPMLGPPFRKILAPPVTTHDKHWAYLLIIKTLGRHHIKNQYFICCSKLFNSISVTSTWCLLSDGADTPRETTRVLG